MPGRCELSARVGVEPFRYEGGTLRLTLRIEVVSEPEGEVLGNIEKKLTMQDVASHDEAKEKELLQRASEVAADDLAKNVRLFVSDDPAEPRREGTEPACGAPCRGQAGAALVTALQKRAANSRRCYERALASDKTLRGRVTAHVTVGADGSLCEVSAETEERDLASVASCVANQFRTPEHLPAPEGGCAAINVPIRFVPRSEDAGVR